MGSRLPMQIAEDDVQHVFHIDTPGEPAEIRPARRLGDDVLAAGWLAEFEGLTAAQQQVPVALPGNGTRPFECPLQRLKHFGGSPNNSPVFAEMITDLSKCVATPGNCCYPS